MPGYIHKACFVLQSDWEREGFEFEITVDHEFSGYTQRLLETVSILVKKSIDKVNIGKTLFRDHIYIMYVTCIYEYE